MAPQVCLRLLERGPRHNTLRILPLVARKQACLLITKFQRQLSCEQRLEMETLGSQQRIKIMIGRATGVIVERKHTFDRAAQKSDIGARLRDKTMQTKIQMSLDQAVPFALRLRKCLKSG